MKELLQDIDVRVYCKLEKRAAKVGLSVAEYVSLFLTNGVEPISQ